MHYDRALGMKSQISRNSINFNDKQNFLINRKSYRKYATVSYNPQILTKTLVGEEIQIVKYEDLFHYEIYLSLFSVFKVFDHKACLMCTKFTW